MSCGIHEFLSYFTNYRAKGSAAFEGNQKLPISSTHPSPSRMHSISREVGIRHLRSVPPQLVKFDKIKTTRCKEKLVIIREIRGSKKTKCYERLDEEDTEEGGGDCDHDYHSTAHHAGRTCRRHRAVKHKRKWRAAGCCTPFFLMGMCFRLFQAEADDLLIKLLKYEA